MKCPFDPNYVMIVKQFDPKYRCIKTIDTDDEELFLHCTANDSTQTTIHNYRDCIQWECGSYQNDKCVRR
jgi:hypothetical protein